MDALPLPSSADPLLDLRVESGRIRRFHVVWQVGAQQVSEVFHLALHVLPVRGHTRAVASVMTGDVTVFLKPEHEAFLVFGKCGFHEEIRRKRDGALSLFLTT